MCSKVDCMSIPLILASKSQPRRDVLFNAGICPTIRVSHADEDAVLEQAAQRQGVSVDELPIADKVCTLSRAKATVVYEIYRNVVRTAAEATGERVIGRPLEVAAEQTVVDAGSSAAEYTAQTIASAQTRDFSNIDIPTEREPIDTTGGLADRKVGPLILGCDSMFLLNGHAYGKPHAAAIARERLQEMSGATGELWTGHTLIDFATGRVETAASRATLTFCEFTETMIDRYITSGEPLEVAGSFTLDGLGGAFIDSITGAPSGIIGLSLPLARELVERMGIEWTDLWNVSRDERFQESSAKAPKTNVRQPGDGWVECACGRRHWGLNGAAGVLLARRDAETGKVTHIVMQHRAEWSAEGGTWGIPGGAIADGESTLEGALREANEEANITPEDIEVVGSYCEDHGPWSYTTVFAFEKPGHVVHPKANDDESMEIEWVAIDEVPGHKLLTAMRTDWPRFRTRLDALAEEYQGR